MPSENRVIIACAGSGKTTRLVDETLKNRCGRIAITTYTNNNTIEIKKKFGTVNSGVPANVDVATWFGFLLREFARPYQRAKCAENSIESICFPNGKSALGVPESDTKNFYFANDSLIYSDKLSRFIVECEGKSGNRVSRRLQQIYSHIYVDEFQDLSGWDLDVIEMLLKAGICVTVVGDPRQHIYSTNPSPKNKNYRGVNVLKLVEKWVRKCWCNKHEMNQTYRCHAKICDFANRLWPDMDPMKSLSVEHNSHSGMFTVSKQNIEKYVDQIRPQVLRHDKRAKRICTEEEINFGKAKGLQFDHVLINPIKSFKEYLKTGDLEKLTSREKFHVAITRAKYSVAFLYDGPVADCFADGSLQKWEVE